LQQFRFTGTEESDVNLLQETRIGNEEGGARKLEMQNRKSKLRHKFWFRSTRLSYSQMHAFASQPQAQACAHDGRAAGSHKARARSTTLDDGLTICRSKSFFERP